MDVSATCTDTVQVRDVYKSYGLVKAVKGITFGIDVGTCFGLLGINGAGKTTTFSMLTGEVLPTKGQLVVDGHDVVQEPEKIKRLVGYCPQFDALWDKLTAREHLQLYGAVKGVRNDKMKQEVDSILSRMGLNEFADKLAGGFSGGNKRKLSVGCALIGNPRIVFLDEPSTGMDPVARRQMWGIIAQVTTRDKSCCTILTTHSMEECEALCTRICIMVAGRLKCIGSGQHLKARFAKSFTMQITLELPTEEEKQKLQQRIFELVNGTAAPSSAVTTKTEVEMTMVSPKNNANGTANPPKINGIVDPAVTPTNSPRIARLMSNLLLQNTSLAPLFQGNAQRMDKLLQDLGVQARFPWFHASFPATPYGGLDQNMTARDAGIFMMERERMLCMKGFIQQNFPNALLKEEFGNKLLYQIPNTDATGVRRELADMFGLVEAEKVRLGIQHYAIGQMSLEQIFNMFAAGEDNPDNARYKNQPAPSAAAAAEIDCAGAAAVEVVDTKEKENPDEARYNQQPVSAPGAIAAPAQMQPLESTVEVVEAPMQPLESAVEVVETKENDKITISDA